MGVRNLVVRGVFVVPILVDDRQTWNAKSEVACVEKALQADLGLLDGGSLRDRVGIVEAEGPGDRKKSL